MNKPRVLLIDDDAGILEVLQDSVRVSVDCDIDTTLSAEEALRMMEESSYDTVVSDIRLDGMDGATFLTIVRERHPSTMRIAFSARSDSRVGLQSAGAVHLFYLKPSDLVVIGDKIASLLKLRSLLGDKGVDRIVSQLKSLPSLPTVYLEIEQAAGDPNESVDHIGHILEKDISMSVKILQLVNSSFFGLREHVTQPARAAILLGLNIVKSLVLAVHVFESWKQKTQTSFSLEELWNHSLRVSTHARAITRLEGLPSRVQEDTCVAGLFHDIGKLILEDNMPDTYDIIQKRVAAGGITRVEAERDILGTTHAEVGAYLLALWGFSDTVTHACAFHHRPADSAPEPFLPLAALHVANALDHEADTGTPPPSALDTVWLTASKLTGRLDAWRGLIAAHNSPA